jgi:UDP-2,3-diacylglucosamine pyrophosphatase LpxH
MITNICEDRLIIISDLHLGNPFCFSKRKIVEFLAYAADNDYNLCINGDGFDIAQTSFVKLAQEVPEVFKQFRRFAKKNLKVYYVIGNHDMVLEHFFEDWDLFTLAPFLNVTSGDLRVRIEHGHLYDPFFIKMPELYEIVTHIAGFFLSMTPWWYKFWMGLEKWWYKFWMGFDKMLGYLRQRKTRKQNIVGIVGEAPSISQAARRILDRGFDAVVFGHTHHPGEVDINNLKYFNTGSWLLHTLYVEITDGTISLKNHEF